MIRVNLSRVSSGFKNSLKNLKEKVNEIDSMIKNKTGEGANYLGWTTFPAEISLAELKKINKTAERIRNNCDVLVVVGIGGSYLGAKATIDAINGIVNESKCKIVYLGNTLSPTYTAQVLKSLEGKKIAINVISKSGTTTEPAIAFRLVAELAKKCWGPKKYAKYVIAMIDSNYPKKVWTVFESQQYKDRCGENSVIPILFDDFIPSPLDALHNKGYERIDTTKEIQPQIEYIANLLIQKLEN